MKNNKGFGLIGILIVIVTVLAIGSLYYFNKNSNTLPKNIDINNQNTDSSRSNSKSINKNTNIICESKEIPLIQKGEQITKQIREDLDNDGIKELMVVYEHMVPGWEGMPMASYRFTLFTCEKGLLVASYEVNPYLGLLDFINYESGKAILLNRYGGGWDILIKNGTTFEKLSPTDQRLQELQKFGVVVLEGQGIDVKVLDNKIEEIVQVVPSSSPSGALLCEGGGEYVKIIYVFEDNNFSVFSKNAWKEITTAGKDFSYPINWLCSNDNRFIPETLKIQHSYDYVYNLYPISRENEVDSITSLSTRQNVIDCNNWLQNNTYKHKVCISLGDSGYIGDRISIFIYTNSNSQAVIDGFNLFLKTNKI